MIRAIGDGDIDLDGSNYRKAFLSNGKCFNGYKYLIYCTIFNKISL